MGSTIHRSSSIFGGVSGCGLVWFRGEENGVVVVLNRALSGVLLCRLPWCVAVGVGPNRTALTVGKMGI